MNVYEGRDRRHTVEEQGFPTVSMDDDGSFVIAWESRDQDGSETGIYGRRYDPAGQPIGGEFRLNGYTEGWQEEIGVATKNGTLVGVWISGGFDGDADAIIGRIWR